jgi:hypothetical protein
VSPRDFKGPARLPRHPTSALPGSPTKLAVLIERTERRETLWHPDDAQIPEDGQVSPGWTPALWARDFDLDNNYRAFVEALDRLERTRP